MATSNYIGDTSSSGSTRVVFNIPDLDPITGSTDSEYLIPEGMFERTCKRCGFPFDSSKRKAQICAECKTKQNKIATGR